MNLTLQESSFDFAVRIWHRSADPVEIGRELNWHPTLSKRVGEPRSTPKGNPLPGQNRESTWYAKLGVEPGESLASAIGRANQKLATGRSYLERLTADGGKVEYFIGWFVEANSGEVLDSILLRACADLEVQLAFDVYAGGRKAGPKEE